VRTGLDEARKARTAISDHVLEMRMIDEQRHLDQQRISKQLYGLCMVVADGDPISERWCEVGR
jgi:hypothetical protein